MPKKTLNSDEGSQKKLKTPELLRGFRDILPEQQVYWDLVLDIARKISTDYSFGRVRLPLLERTVLFERSVGKGTDIVDKEMFTFVDQGGDRVTLRPEATAQITRAYINHGMLNLPQPVKLWYAEPMFRYDRPQAGRYRQFWQWGLEAIGSEDPIIDAQIIFMCFQLMKELGLHVKVRINSIGTESTRREYVMELVSYFKQFRKKLSDTDKKRLTKNPLRLLDSKEPGMEELKQDAPQIVDWLDEDSRQHFMKVLEYLDEVEVHYELDPFLVRGLDYYSKTVFEIVLVEDDNEKSQNALAGGGRYDDLVYQLGGRVDVKGAMGAAVGIERVISALKDSGIEVEKKRKIDVFFCQLGEAARRQGMVIFENFRQEGVAIAEAFGKGSLKTQLEMANKTSAKIALILGQKEVLDGTIIVRDMESGAQEIVDSAKVVQIVKKQLS
ncbi:histidine--tRNA ligase [Patescibacteria group bacterium]|nr:histidine--tRNA ligase [Patescibacteria group bacterium]